MKGMKTIGEPVVYWHRELPPFDAEPLGEHTMEAASSRVLGTLAHRDELWERCYDELMTQTHERLAQEVARLGGSFAHVLSESVDSRHDPVSGEAWLHGLFTYMLYRRGAKRAGEVPKRSAEMNL
jgi:hypothetical protein